MPVPPQRNAASFESHETPGVENLLEQQSGAHQGRSLNAFSIAAASDRSSGEV